MTSCSLSSSIIIYPLTARAFGAPQMIYLFSSLGESRAKYNPTEPIPLQVEHVAVEFIEEPFRPSGPFLLITKISSQ